MGHRWKHRARGQQAFRRWNETNEAKVSGQKTNFSFLTLANWSAVSHILQKAGITLRWSRLCGGELELGWCCVGVGSYNIFLPCAGSIIEYHSSSQSNWILKFFSGFSKAAQPAGGMAEIRTDLSLIPPNLDFFHNIVTSGRKSLAEKSYCVSRMTYFFMMLTQCGCFKDIFWRIIRF